MVYLLISSYITIINFIFNLVDAGSIRNKEDKTNANQTLSHLNVENSGLLSNPSHTDGNNTPNERINVELSESDLQLQVKMNETLNISKNYIQNNKSFSCLQITDEEGNPIPLSIQDARQLLSQSQFVNQLGEGQEIRVHPGVITDELTAPLTMHVNQDSSIKGVDIANTDEAKVKNISTVQTDAEAIVKALEVI